MALVVLSVVEQRLDAVRAALDGGDVAEIAAGVGVHRTTLHRWMARYLVEGIAGLSDRSHRPGSCPHWVGAQVEVRIAEMRREHPRWGAKRIRMEMLRRPVEGVTVPSLRTVVRILQRQGLARSKPRKRPRDSYLRFERPGPMQLWQMDIVGGVLLVNTVTGELREAKVVTAVDDHSRYCVIAKVVERATSRAVCLALAEALVRFGVPEEIITDNGKQFTDRFGKRGEVLFDKICRRNAITHRLTQPASPNQNGKVERFHGTFRPDFLDGAGPFTSVEAAQAAVDAYVVEYNTDRPHQGLDNTVPVTPAERFAPVPPAQRELVDLWLPPLQTTHLLDAATTDRQRPPTALPPTTAPVEVPPQGHHGSGAWAGGAVEFDRVVPASGNLAVAGKQFWLGAHRAGVTVRFWADVDVIHLLVAGARIKSVRSHLSLNDIARLVGLGAVDAGPPPLPAPEDGDALEVDRVVSRAGTVSLGQHVLLAAEILGGRQVGIRVEPAVLMFFDLQTRELLRTRPNPLTEAETKRIRGARKAGPPPRPSTEPITVQRRASNSGVVMVCGQKVALGRAHKHQTVTIAVSETTLAIQLPDGDSRVIRRTTTQPVRSIKGHRPRTASVS